MIDLGDGVQVMVNGMLVSIEEERDHKTSPRSEGDNDINLYTWCGVYTLNNHWESGWCVFSFSGNLTLRNLGNPQGIASFALRITMMDIYIRMNI